MLEIAFDFVLIPACAAVLVAAVLAIGFLVVLAFADVSSVG